MKTAASVSLLLAVLLLSGCGKVGAPLPPIIRIPEKVVDLKAAQTGLDVVLTWTNPAKYVDGNAASDLGEVHVFRNNEKIGTVDATAGGQPQSYAVNVADSLGTPMTFTIQMVLAKARRSSAVSNPYRIQPVDVPGTPRELVATVDKGEIVLEWKAPERHPELVEEYRVQRSDRPAPTVVRTPQFRDTEYDAGKKYGYTITAVRANPPVAGVGNATLQVEATDKNKPAAPAGVQVQLLGGRVFIQWNPNTEPDLKGYSLFRSDKPDQPIPVGRATGAYDPAEYVPGSGLSYWVRAEDDFGNVSDPSPRQPGP